MSAVLFPIVLRGRVRPHLSEGGQPAVEQIGDQHVAGRMGDAEFRTHGRDNRLRGNAAGPENRYLAGADFDRVAVVRAAEVGDADQCGMHEPG